jgi:hypothetical protein
MLKNILFLSFFGSLALSLEAGYAIGRLLNMGCNPTVHFGNRLAKADLA